eukprot:scpid37951/ scgid27572/ 
MQPRDQTAGGGCDGTTCSSIASQEVTAALPIPDDSVSVYQSHPDPVVAAAPLQLWQEQSDRTDKYRKQSSVSSIGNDTSAAGPGHNEHEDWIGRGHRVITTHLPREPALASPLQQQKDGKSDKTPCCDFTDSHQIASVFSASKNSSNLTQRHLHHQQQGKQSRTRHQEAVGKENRMKLNEWQPLRAPMVMPKKNGPAARRLLPAQIAMELSLGSGKPDSPIPSTADLINAAAPSSLETTNKVPLGHVALSDLRPVRTHGRVSGGGAPPPAEQPLGAGFHQHRRAPAFNNPHSAAPGIAEKPFLNKTWPSGKQAWSPSSVDSPRTNTLAVRDSSTSSGGGIANNNKYFGSRVASLSTSAPTLGETQQSDKHFLRLRETLDAALGGTDVSHHSGLRKKDGKRKSDPLALSLPSVVPLPSIAEESQITTQGTSIGGKNVSSRKLSIGNGRKFKGAAIEHRLADEKKPLRPKAAKKQPREEDLEIHGYSTAKDSSKRQSKDRRQKKAASRDGREPPRQWRGLLPELTASTPYLTTSKLDQPASSSTRKRTEPVPSDTYNFDFGDPKDFVMSDEESDLDI